MSNQENIYRRSLSSFLPKETIDMVKSHIGPIPPDLGFEQDMTILFTDMRDFTAISEAFEPREVYRTINASLAIQTHYVHEYGGSINKFLGDGVLACFSGEDRSVHVRLSVYKPWFLCSKNVSWN